MDNTIRVTFASADGFRETRLFKTLHGARRFAQRAVGETPELGRHYAVSADGIATIAASSGCTLLDLFPAIRGTKLDLTDAEMDIALYGDGLPTYHAYGPNEGERIYNTKEDDARAEAGIAEWRNNIPCPF